MTARRDPAIMNAIHQMGAPVAKDIVYVVDDDDEVRESMSFLLRSQGYACLSFSSGQDFLSVLMTLEPGCIFLDFRMGGLTGLQVLSEVRWLGLEWPVAIMTGHGDETVGTKARGLGALEFLEKPFDQEQLAGVLARGFAIIRSLDTGRAGPDAS